MTRLFDDPADFTDDMVAGFVDVYGRYVRAVPGGVVRADGTPAGKTAVVIGGGSGHYPAFCGLVGPGFADGAVVGNIFTSPSAEYVCSVARQASNGGGVVLSFGNYAGDVMNFGLAADRLRSEGIDTRIVVVTDDIASAPPEQAETRRGIAGDVVGFKILAAAAAAGYDLDAVEAAGRHANAQTRTLGVAFSGCTLPGAREPLFTIADGRMGTGLGIHGEPGISEDQIGSAADTARLLVDGLLAERPRDAGDRVAVLLNGLGATAREELFVLWGSVSRLLRGAGLRLVSPQVGDFVTSLDMAGCSLTLTWLDEELERLWTAPADSPGFHWGDSSRAGGAAAVGAGADSSSRAPAQQQRAASPAATSERPASPRSLACSAVVTAALGAMEAALREAEAELGKLDAVAGDGDHGRGMVKGVSAAASAARETADGGAGAEAVLVAAGKAWAGQAGGTSGALWGSALEAFGRALAASGLFTPDDVVSAAEAALRAVTALGHASPGDKTMVDALVPFTNQLRTRVEEGDELADAWQSGARQALASAQATAELSPKTGRARPLAARSVGTPDPGAISLAISLEAVARVLSDRNKDKGEDDNDD